MNALASDAALRAGTRRGQPPSHAGAPSGVPPHRGGVSHRFLLIIALCLAAVLVAGCGSSPRKSSSTWSGGGGYYKDDGPGDNIPANIQNIPDAVPRIEPHNPANLRPYSVMGQRFVPVGPNTPLHQRGVASWYGRKFHGKKTANGETYDMYAMTAAHPTLPLPSYARVTHVASGRSVIVRVNDRGPFLRGRVIDLSYAAAAKLGIIGKGSDVVTVQAITHADIRRGWNVASAPRTPVATAAAPVRTSRPSAAPAPAQPPQPVVRQTIVAQPASGGATPARVTVTPAPAAAVATHSDIGNAGPATGQTTPDALAAIAGQVPGTQPVAPDMAANDPGHGEEVPDALAALSHEPLTVAPASHEQPAVAVLSEQRPGTSSHAQTAVDAPRTPQPTLTEAAADGIYLQFGAFASYISADRLANRLNAEIAQVEHRNAHISSSNDLHRVRIGPYASRTAAVNAAVRIQEATGMQPTLAQR
ncbi:septal ring lytic transglycosylase RlpA family protein [Yanghanlia caeni]|uniref:Endolytic peptidoglycan transglycosylase RlpA n=1 Tax=Yanghanlia caeni TaxID=3064283 RepID=A0ABU1D7S6_9BURK|nr:septal ring lytic transglycosylase RlpA family protein [Alcaligenaceae bacterium LG-2]